VVNCFVGSFDKMMNSLIRIQFSRRFAVGSNMESFFSELKKKLDGNRQVWETNFYNFAKSDDEKAKSQKPACAPVAKPDLLTRLHQTSELQQMRETTRFAKAYWGMAPADAATETIEVEDTSNLISRSSHFEYGQTLLGEDAQFVEIEGSMHCAAIAGNGEYRAIAGNVEYKAIAGPVEYKAIAGPVEYMDIGGASEAVGGPEEKCLAICTAEGSEEQFESLFDYRESLTAATEIPADLNEWLLG
jgi:hypothetical protein